jgi:hypothetical protein
MIVGWKSLELCAVAGFDVSCVEPPGFVTTKLDSHTSRQLLFN